MKISNAYEMASQTVRVFVKVERFSSERHGFWHELGPSEKKEQSPALSNGFISEFSVWDGKALGAINAYIPGVRMQYTGQHMEDRRLCETFRRRRAIKTMWRRPDPGECS